MYSFSIASASSFSAFFFRVCPILYLSPYFFNLIVFFQLLRNAWKRLPFLTLCNYRLRQLQSVVSSWNGHRITWHVSLTLFTCTRFRFATLRLMLWLASTNFPVPKRTKTNSTQNERKQTNPDKSAFYSSFLLEPRDGVALRSLLIHSQIDINSLTIK